MGRSRQSAASVNGRTEVPVRQYTRPAAVGGFKDAGRASAPCPRVRVRRGRVDPARLSAGLRHPCSTETVFIQILVESHKAQPPQCFEALKCGWPLVGQTEKSRKSPTAPMGKLRPFSERMLLSCQSISRICYPS